jgi:hypothetical protein
MAAHAGAQVSKLHSLLRPFLLRRIKADVEDCLPLKAELLLYAHMAPDQQRLNEQLCDRTVNVRCCHVFLCFFTCSLACLHPLGMLNPHMPPCLTMPAHTISRMATTFGHALHPHACTHYEAAR